MPATLVRRLTAAAAIAAVLAAASTAAPATAADDIGRQTEELRNVERQIGNAKSRTAALDREREALQAEMADVSQRLVDLAGNIQTFRK